MSTTIRVGEDTRERLAAIKESRGYSSYEELIERLLEKESERISMFGADPDLDEWSREDRVSDRA